MIQRMPTDQLGAGIMFGGVLSAAALIYVLTGRRAPARRRARRTSNPWITLKNKQRVRIDDEGRIERGLPDLYRDVHIADLKILTRGIRSIEGEGAEEEDRITRGRRGQTFKSTDLAVRALLEANPPLVDFLETECSHDCASYRKWIARGRRGRKPQWSAGDGRFDAANERWDKKRGRKISSWLEVVYTTPPPSRRWADFPERLAVLEEATGLRLNLPDQAEAFDRSGEEIDAVRQRTDERIAAIVHLARTRRLDDDGLTQAGPMLEDAPF
jgi:hypothetical protein